MEFADELGMELTWVGYSRKNLQNPSAQQWPHSNFDDEIRFIDTHQQLQKRLRGSGHVLGPVTGDHWFVYVADHSVAVPSEKIAPKDRLIRNSNSTKTASYGNLLISNCNPPSSIDPHISLSGTST